jgi:hypothetical protein
VYHYCSLAALYAIVEYRKLWASDVRFLNDRSELLFAKSSTRDAMDLIIGSLPGTFSPRTARQIVKRAVNEEFRLFATSFSAQPDKLSQWSRYAQASKGVAIGFSKSTLEGMGYAVREITYGETVLSALIGELTSIMCSTSKVPEFKKDAFRKTIEILSSTKHAGFSEEEEIRMCVFTHQYHDADVQYRVSADLVVPYIEIDLSLHWDNVIEEVWIGPLNSDAMATDSLREFLNSRGLTHVRIARSKATVR